MPTHPTVKEWLEAGYRAFSEGGEVAVSITDLSRQIHRSKTSFYNYFQDRDSFLIELIKLHLRGLKPELSMLSQSTHPVPASLDWIYENPGRIKFQKNLRIYSRNNPKALALLEEIQSSIERLFLRVFKKQYGLKHREAKEAYISFREEFYGGMDGNSLVPREECNKILEKILRRYVPPGTKLILNSS